MAAACRDKHQDHKGNGSGSGEFMDIAASSGQKEQSAYPPGVLVVGHSFGQFSAKGLLKMGAWLTVAESVILLLMVPFYWPLIGIQ